MQESANDDPAEPRASTLPAVAAGALDVLHADLESAAAYKQAARSVATLRAYASDWAIYQAWCSSRGLEAMPAHPEQIAAFASNQADAAVKPSTIVRRVAAIGHYHRANLYPAPTAHPQAGGLRETLAGIRHARLARKTRKTAADASALRAMLSEIAGDGLRARRDRALLAIGMAGALRRSELVALDVGDVLVLESGIELTVTHSKTDQAGEGATIAIPEGSRIRPKALLLEWMAAAGHDHGALFRRLTRKDELTDDPMSDKAVARLVKRCAAAAGYDPAKFSGHSLRAGFLTEAAAQGATIFKMQEVSRHKTVQILSEYVRSADRFRNHAGEGFL